MGRVISEPTSMTSQLSSPFLRALALAAVTCAAASSGAGQVLSPVQGTTSATDKWGLPLAGVTNLAGSDSAAATFQKNVLPDIVSLLNKSLGETVMLKDQAAHALDPTKLLLATAATARVYFVGEGAGYANTLGFNTLTRGAVASTPPITDSAKLIFPNASSSVSTYNPTSTVTRTATNPLLPGDFVDLGKFQAGTTLDFFLISNGANGGSSVFTAPAARNADKIDHVVSFALPDSPYLILAFEDMYGGGDRDYNDVIFAIDIGRENVAQLIGAPEPQVWAILAGFSGILIFVERRVRRRGGAMASP